MEATTEKYYGTGRRKTAVAKVWVWPGEGRITVNDKEMTDRPAHGHRPDKQGRRASGNPRRRYRRTGRRDPARDRPRPPPDGRELQETPPRTRTPHQGPENERAQEVRAARRQEALPVLQEIIGRVKPAAALRQPVFRFRTSFIIPFTPGIWT